MMGLGAIAVPALQAVGSIVDELWTSDEEKLDKQAILARLAQQPAMVQAEINKVEAAHRSIFVAGWRPAIGWVCAASLAYEFVGYPALLWYAELYHPGLVPPVILNENLFELVLAMLGMAGLRTFEKARGRAK
jgi:hypothetical protein